MAKDKETAQLDLTQTINISAGDLLQLFAKIQQDAANAAKDQNKALVEGLEKLSPSYISPGQVENAKNQREQQRKIEIFKIKNLRRQQKNCQHEVGQTGRKRLGEGAFCGLKLPTGETIGICQYCQMIISSENPEHQKYFRQINGTVAHSGQADGITDPIKARLARLSEDERAKVIASRAKYFAENPKDELEEDEDLVSI